MITMKQFEKGIKQFERGVEKFVADAKKKFEIAKPHIERTEKKEKFFLKRIGSTFNMTEARKRSLLRERRGECEWCGKKGKLYRSFNCAVYKHALCRDCQDDRVHMLGYGLI